MFKKKPHIKTLSPLRSSDRRKTADKIIQDYGLAASSAKNGDDQGGRTSLRTSLLPENTLSAKFTTTSGPNLSEVSGIVYIGSHDASDQRVLWIRIEEQLYPTVYTLWHNHNLGIIPLLHTPAMVVQKLMGGADLMTPGLAGPPFPEGAKEDAVVAIATLDNPTVPVAVGTCLIDVSALSKAQGEKGHAVRLLHHSQDEIWDWSVSGKSGLAAPSHLDGWQDVNLESSRATDEMHLEDDDVDGGVALNPSTDSDRANGTNLTPEPNEDVSDEPEMTTDEIDKAFKRAFLFGIYSQKISNRSDPKHGLVFPLTQSVVMSSLVLPFLPAHTTKQTEALVIKKTSWKNARKFIKSLGKDKILFCKDRTTEIDVWDIDFEDATIQDFKPYRLPKKDNKPTAMTEQSSATADESIGQQLKKVELYKPRDSLSRLFSSSDKGTKGMYTAVEIRQAISDYIEATNLSSPTNKRIIRLDPIIANSVFSSSSTLDNEVLAKGTVPRDALTDRIISLCAPFHVILRNGENATDVKPKAGTAPKVNILLQTVSGNKTATKISGLEPFSINPQILADELRKSCASSTSVEPFKAGKGLEIMVQGPQKDGVLKALEKRGVSKQWVEVIDKIKGKKK